MPGAFNAVNLAAIPAPAIVEQLSYESIVAQMISDLQARDPSFSALVESDPAYKVIEVCAYREMLVRQRTNESCFGVMLSFAKGSDLDQLGANFNVVRLLVDPGNPLAIPPVAPTFEADNDFRTRIQLSFEGYTTAGSAGSYVFQGLSADGQVKDVSPVSPAPGQVVVYVMSRSGDGSASSDLCDTVAAALDAEHVRPMTDQVTVQSVAIVPYTIQAELVMYPGPDANVVLAAAQVAAQAYADSVHKCGFDVALSAVYAALQQTGVQRVNLAEPVANITIGDGEAPYCTAISLTIAAATNV